MHRSKTVTATCVILALGIIGWVAATITSEVNQQSTKKYMNPISADNDAWNVANGTNPDKPSVLRYRPNLQERIADPAYGSHLTIIWPYDSDNKSGMPNDLQNIELGNFEDTVVDALDSSDLAILAFVFTCAGQREWHFYVSDVGAVGQAINEALAGQPVLPIELTVEDDPEWSEYQEVLRGCGHID
jgi:hypothetical protein